METSVSFLNLSELLPDLKSDDTCGKCIADGLNLCSHDEICQIRLASALGRGRKKIDVSVDEAKTMGFIKVREIHKGSAPRKFIKLTPQGEMFFALMG